MIIPIRCFTCGKVLADKWEFYVNETKKLKTGTIINVNSKNIQTTVEGKALDKLKLNKYCCRRMMISHIDLLN